MYLSGPPRSRPTAWYALPLRVAEAVERHAAVATEVACRLTAVLEHGDDIRAGCAEVLVGLAQLDEVLAAERSAEVAHERDHERHPAPALSDGDVTLAA